VEVDRPALLELGHLGIGDPDQPPQASLAQADLAGQGTLDSNGGAPPELRGQGVPQHLGVGVVAGRTQRLPEARVVGVVAMPAASPAAMRAAGALAVRMAGQDQPPLCSPVVDAAEARGGEGHEQPRMASHALGDALAALQPGGQQVVGVSPVDGCTRRAARLPPGAARLQHHPIRLPVGVVHGADLAGYLVGVLDPTGLAVGLVAVAFLFDLV